MSCDFRAIGRSPSILEINYGIIATVAAAAVARCYLKFVRGVAPRSVNMSGKVRQLFLSFCPSWLTGRRAHGKQAASVRLEKFASPAVASRPFAFRRFVRTDARERDTSCGLRSTSCALGLDHSCGCIQNGFPAVSLLPTPPTGEIRHVGKERGFLLG